MEMKNGKTAHLNDPSTLDDTRRYGVLRRMSPFIDEVIEAHGCESFAEEILYRTPLGQMFQANMYLSMRRRRDAQMRAALFMADQALNGEMKDYPDAALLGFMEQIADLNMKADTACRFGGYRAYGDFTNRDMLCFGALTDTLRFPVFRTTKPGRLLAHQLIFEDFREKVRATRAEADDPDTAYTAEENEKIDRVLAAIENWEGIPAELEQAIRDILPKGTIGSCPYIGMWR